MSVLGTPDTHLAIAAIAVLSVILYYRRKNTVTNTKLQQRKPHDSGPEALQTDFNPKPAKNYKSDEYDEFWDTGNTQTDNKQPGETPSNRVEDNDNLEFHWQKHTEVSFDDVGGMSETKHELKRDVIKPLTTGKEKADDFGISVPNLLFYGPPGTGKTYMAKALATELGLPFTKLSGADIQTKWINQSAQKVNQLFTEAKQVAAKEGGAVVFIDELDSVLRDRDDTTNAHAEDQKVVNEFLNQLQDLDEYDIVFIGATNRVDILDSAGIRAGRIDKKIEIGLPDKDARRSVIKHHVTDRPSDVDARIIDNIADVAEGWNAADLEALVERAAKIAVFDRDASKITGHDLATAYRDHADE